MAEIKSFLSPEAIKQQDDYIKKLKVIKEGYEATAKSSMQLLTNIEKIQVTTKNTSETQKKLNKTTSEAAKLQKQYETNTEKLRIVQGNYSKAVIRTRMELQENTKEIKRNITISKAQEGAYNKINAALLKNIDKWKKLSQEERENTAAGKQLTRTIKQQDAQLKKLDSQLGRHQRNVGNYGSALKGVASSLLGAFGVVGGVAMFARVMKDAFGTIRSFTKENAVLAGVLGTTRDQVSQLTEQAVALGSQYPVLASDVTKLQVSYARLGFTQSEIINLTEATIQGSIALNSSLDQTATLVGAVVKAYGNLGTSDSSRIIDVLTKATQRSSLSFESLETALPKVAAAASALNVDLETVSAQLGIAQDATLDASISGTSLRNIYLELAGRGISLEQALNQINNSSNRLSASFDLFGKRGAIVGLALADNIEKTAELEKELRNAGGTAERVAKEQMDTLDGSIKSFQSSWEKMILSFRNSDGVWRKVIDSATQFIDTFSDKRIAGWQKFVELATLGFWDLATEQQQAFAAVERTIAKTNSKQLQHYLDYYRDELEAEGKYGKQRIEIIEKAIAEKQKTEQKDREEKQKRDENSSRQAEVEQLASQREVSEKINKELEKNREKLESEAEKERQKRYEDELKAGEALIEADIAIEEEREEAVKKSIDEIDKANEEANKKRIDDAKRRNEIEKDLEKDLAETKKQFITDSVNSIFDINAAANEKKIEQLEEEKEILLSNEQLTNEERKAIEEDYAKKQEEIRNKQKTADKIQSAIDVGIKTAQSIFEIKAAAAVLLSNPLTAALAPIALAQIPFVLGSSALALASIAAFEKGTDNAPHTGLFGESGAELMRTQKGDYYYADSPTVFSGSQFEHAKIWNAKETNDILSDGIVRGRNIDELINISLIKGYDRGFDRIAKGQEKGFKQVVRAVKDNNRTRSYKNTLETRSGNTIKRYHNQFN